MSEKNKAALWLCPAQVAYFEGKWGSAKSKQFKAFLKLHFPDMPEDNKAGNPNLNKSKSLLDK